MNTVNKVSNFFEKGSSNFGKKFLIPLSIVLAISVVAKTVDDSKTRLSNVLLEQIDREWVAEEYLKNNLFIKDRPITNEEFGHSITKIDKDVYQIKYSHQFEWIPDFSEASRKEVILNVRFSYKNNNIYIEFEEVKIWKHKLKDNGALIMNNTVYDYDISQGFNKSIEINSKVNQDKTLVAIRNKIKEYEFSFLWLMEIIEEFENTQLTKLNDLSLWKEVMKEWEFYYREMFLRENGKYRPIAKVYFDKYGNWEQKKTKEEFENKKSTVLWTTISFDVQNHADTVIPATANKNWDDPSTSYVQEKDIAVSISDNSKEQLKKKVKDHRQQIINIIDKAKVGPNREFKWFNKINSERVWSDKKEWLFDTKLISLELIDDTYVFQRWDKTQAIYFGIENKGWEKDNIFLKNTNNQKVENFFVTINNNYYQVSLKNDELIIYKIKKEGMNVSNNLPVFAWNQKLANILNAKNINIYYNVDGRNLEYRTKDWSLVTYIPCEKTEQWEYKLGRQSINIDIPDLYNYPEFKKIVNDIQKIQKELNVLDVDILNSFWTLLNRKWVKLDHQELVRIVDQGWTTHYCTIKQTKDWMRVDLDAKLYKDVEKTLDKLKLRLEIVKKLNNTKIRWVNKWKQEDFTKFVWWGWWIWTRFISQNNIIDFISQASNEVELELLRWEGQQTKIIYDISAKSWKMKLRWKSVVYISWQDYKIKINENWEVFLDPVEKK